MHPRPLTHSLIILLAAACSTPPSEPAPAPSPVTVAPEAPDTEAGREPAARPGTAPSPTGAQPSVPGTIPPTVAEPDPAPVDTAAGRAGCSDPGVTVPVPTGATPDDTQPCVVIDTFPQGGPLSTSFRIVGVRPYRLGSAWGVALTIKNLTAAPLTCKLSALGIVARKSGVEGRMRSCWLWSGTAGGPLSFEQHLVTDTVTVFANNAYCAVETHAWTTGGEGVDGFSRGQVDCDGTLQGLGGYQLIR